MIGNKKDKVIFLTNRDQIFNNYVKVFNQEKVRNRLLDDMNIEFLFADAKNVAEIGIKEKLRIEAGNLVLISWMGAPEDPYIKQLEKEMQKGGTRFAMHFTTSTLDSHFGLIDAEQAEIFQKYLSYGGIQNTIGLFSWIASTFYNKKNTYELPQELPWEGIYHPDYDEALTLETYQKNISRNGCQ